MNKFSKEFGDFLAVFSTLSKDLQIKIVETVECNKTDGEKCQS